MERLTSVTADEEDGVEFVGATGKGGEFGGVLPQDGLRAVEVDGEGVVFGGLDRGRVQGGFAAGRRGDGDFGDVAEDLVGVRELG